MSEGAKHFDSTTEGGLRAIAWWDAMTETERSQLLKAADTTEPAIAYVRWQRWQEMSFLLNQNVAATETEPSPVSPPVSRSVAAALLASLESILCFIEPDSVSDQCDDARLREEFAAVVERAHEAVAQAKAGGL